VSQDVARHWKGRINEVFTSPEKLSAVREELEDAPGLSDLERSHLIGVCGQYLADMGPSDVVPVLGGVSDASAT